MRIKHQLEFQEKDNGAHIFTTIRIFRKNYIALIDTGATSTAFDLDFVKEHSGDKHLQLLDNKAGGLGTTEMLMFGTDLKFKIGNASFNQVVALIDFSHIHQLYEMHGLKKFHFIIGNDILINTKAIINYSTKTISLEQSAAKKKK